MMNCNKLKGKLIEKGMTYEDCSTILNISITAFSNKMNGKSVFTVPEANKLSNALDLDNIEKCEIFLN